MSKPVIVVVGAGPGLGGATAHRFARDGYDVGLIARDPDRLARLATDMEADGIDVGYAAADVANAESLHRALTRMIEHTGRLDVLLHNPSVFRGVPALETTAEQLLADLAIGAASLLTSVQAALPIWRAQRTGTLLVTGSGSADQPPPGGLTLGAQKSAIRALVQGLAPELAELGVHAATVTIYGFLKEGTPFAPARIADLYADLVAETAGDPASWRTVIDLRA